MDRKQPEINLFTPGPTHIPDGILRAMSISELHHRTAEFQKLFQETREHLALAMHSDTLPLFLSCSGTGGMEAVVVNSVGPEDTLGFLDAGKFGERWGDIADAAGIRSTRLHIPWGETPTTEQVLSFLEESPEVTHFALQYCETSTTVEHNVPELTAAIRERFPHIILIIDAISSATTVKWKLQEQHWDAVITASQKAFMLPPGLTMLFLSDRYWDSCERVLPKTLYFRLAQEKTSQDKGSASWTPTISIIAGLRAALSLFEDEGWENVYARHRACREEAMHWFMKLGFSLINEKFGAHGVTGARPPAALKADKLCATLATDFHIRIAGGQGKWKGEIMRVGHMGVVSPKDVERCFSYLQEVIQKG